ncbi:MAG: 4-coumarate--CoA ligase [Alphaproteobacteria bacterium]|nr:MAG: 4-coumarate--CoA ligase [Alphaproteobacteria bacterium]
MTHKVTRDILDYKPDYRDVDDMLRRAARQYRRTLAVEDENSSLLWGEFDTQINQIANALIAKGVVPNDRIAILARNSVAYVCLMFGILRAGACVVPLSTLAASESLADMVTDSGAKLLFVSSDYAHMVLSHEDKLEGLDANGLMFLDGGDSAHDTLKDFIKGAPSSAPNVTLTKDMSFNLIYSSGTTGTPKGILQDRYYRSKESLNMIEGFELDAQTRTLVSTPLYSNTTLFLFIAAIAAGGSAYLMGKFDARKYLELSEKLKITHSVLVPVQYARLLKDPDFDHFDLSSYKAKFSTSAPLHKQVKQDVLNRWPAGGLIEFYGMTEGGVNCTLVAHEFPDKLDTVGQPSPECEILIIGDDGQILPQGSSGEIVGRSPTMMRGYHNREEATAEANWYDEAGQRYHRSGDIGWFDTEGFLHLLDRKKDMIISGGFNIYAIDLEKALLAQAEVSDVAVIGAPSDEWGETPVAFVVGNSLTAVDAEHLRQAVNAKLGKAQRISEIKIVEELPRSPIGKILKRELRASLAYISPEKQYHSNNQ